MLNEVTYELKVADKKDFFKAWVTLLQPFLNIRPKEAEVLAKLIEHRHEIAQSLTDEDEISLILFSTKRRKQMREELNIEELNFNNLIHALRKKPLIINDKLIKKVIPIISKDFKSFKLSYKINVK